MTPSSALEVGYLDEGPKDAPALILSGSLGSTLAIWERLIPALGPFRVIRYDLRGHGSSPVPKGPYTMADLGSDLVGLLDRLDVERASVVGVSLGAMAAMWAAAAAPHRIERLALLCTSARLGAPKAWHDRAETVRRHGVAAVAEAIVGRWFTRRFIEREPLVARAMKEMIASTPVEGYAACCEAIAEWNFDEHLRSIRAPTVVIAGGADEATPAPHAYAIGERIPGARVVVMDGVAHLPVIESPERIAALVLEHLSPLLHEKDGYSNETQAGEQVRRAVLGDAHVDAAKARTTEFSAPFQELVNRYPWGEIWTRPGLSRGERSIVVLAVLAALGHDEELAMHVVAARRNGLTPVQIREVLLQVAVYAGVPAGNRAFRVAERALAEKNLLAD